jgi:hypothetical protein
MQPPDASPLTPDAAPARRRRPANNGLGRATGPQGPQGEVTSTQLASAIAGTASNTNPIATLDIAISDPPTQTSCSRCWQR